MKFLKPGELPTWISVEDELPSSSFTEGYSCIVLSTKKGKSYTISEAVYFQDLKKAADDYYRYFDEEEIENLDSGFFRQIDDIDPDGNLYSYDPDTCVYSYDLIQNVTHWMQMSYRVDK